MLYTNIMKPILFQFDPEKAHHLTMSGMRLAAQLPGGVHLLDKLYGVPVYAELSSEVCGISFANPVGLAAGLDKNAEAIEAFSSIGFGFVEVGTVTPKPQPGNELPRCFRLPVDEALVNRMGFNNIGTDAMAHNLKQVPIHRVPVAVNIGKNKMTPNEQAENDYRECLQKLYAYGDFFVVNISSPNTPDLRNLQHGEELSNLLRAVKDEMAVQAEKFHTGQKPVFVKIAPDLTDIELEYMMETIMQSQVSGVIATNTTIAREQLKHPNAREAGGLSGRPLTKRSTEVIRHIYRLTEGRLPIIGVGGIFSALDAYEKIRAGASLIEVYTALIYRGPALMREINEGLRGLLARDGYSHISEAVGADVKM